VLLVDGMAKLADLGLAHPCLPVPAMCLSPHQPEEVQAVVLEPEQGAVQAWIDLMSGAGVNTDVPWELLWPVAPGPSQPVEAPQRRRSGAGAARQQRPCDQGHAIAGTVAYLAPECMHGHASSQHGAATPAGAGTGPASIPGQDHLHAGGSAADVWALGVMLGEVVSRQLPWKGMRAERIVCLVGLMGQKPYPLLARQSLPAGLAELVDACCSAQPEHRPAAAQVAMTLALMLSSPGW
jgi:serine/threonine protein kinase